jgi:peptidoglycan L-alanyl-D-glutamate endopeptidase CwlK
MPNFGQRSQERLDTCHPDLKRLFQAVVERVDCAILCGHREELEQQQAYEDGVSMKEWPDSDHNTIPSVAVDVAPYFAVRPHIRWIDRVAWYWFAGYVRATADTLGIKVRHGGDWDGDGDFHDQSLVDLPHWEIVI